jgi:hypothetical protein
MHRLTEALLEKVKLFHHNDRIRYVVEYAKTAPPELVQDLMAGQVYERQLAVVCAVSSHNTAALLHGLHDPSQFVQTLARKSAHLLLTDK